MPAKGEPFTSVIRNSEFSTCRPNEWLEIGIGVNSPQFTAASACRY